MQSVPLMGAAQSGQGKRKATLPRSAGEYIRLRRNELGWSIDQLAFRARVPARQIGAYERGENDPGTVNLAKIMRALGDDVPWLEPDSADSSTARKVSLREWVNSEESSVLGFAGVGR